MRAEILIPSLFLAALTTGGAFQNLESTYRTTGSSVVAAFAPQRAVLQTSSAVLLNGRREVCYGVVVSSDGYILTKASEIRKVKSLTVTVDRTVYKNVRVLDTDDEWDVALVKVEAEGLIPVVPAATSDLPQGTWVVANGVTSRRERRLLPGVISANPRPLPPPGGVILGVIFKSGAKSLEIEELGETGGAKLAGLAAGDVIVAVDGAKVSSIEDVTKALDKRQVGSKAKVTYRRKGREHSVDVLLTAREEQISRNDQMSGLFSERRYGFPRVIQHDILGAPSIVGGPLLTLDGKCVGMNISRANRAESFAIPVEEMNKLAGRMIEKAGK